MYKYWRCCIGAANPRLRIEITPLQWGLGFAFRWGSKHYTSKFVLDIGPIVVAFNFAWPNFEKYVSSNLTQRK